MANEEISDDDLHYSRLIDAPTWGDDEPRDVYEARLREFISRMKAEIERDPLDGSARAALSSAEMRLADLYD